ncbi:pectate lyase-like adhesive domain-containing protein [Periweissella fabalis]|uniref:KxYKxGKxW signal peptide domain-containing protein n=1 Tax=Periweissella fabalis TaxID=1070421 RepID=A0A7X6S293_9LACO|nr:pectate lyase-like adhesive domain-containing protein [Periweissella fabalis]MCM0599456.1 KxYKxGKxW signal peptide domain-containing protein [Periweissella fabalis]NKZ23735.1 KxYKxGKxW signal peptide domain-containing protein [Periweissella fabalis]
MLNESIVKVVKKQILITSFWGKGNAKKINIHNNVIAKRRYKMYKAGKNWLYAPIIFIGFGVGMITGMPSHAAADELHNTNTTAIYRQKISDSNDDKTDPSVISSSAATSQATVSSVATSQATVSSAIADSAVPSQAPAAPSKQTISVEHPELATPDKQPTPPTQTTAITPANASESPAATSNAGAATNPTTQPTPANTVISDASGINTPNTIDSLGTAVTTASNSSNGALSNANSLAGQVANTLKSASSVATLSSTAAKDTKGATLKPQMLAAKDASTVANVSTAQQFRDALFNGSITSINLQNDISLSQKNVPFFAGSSIPVRNLTISGATGTTDKYYTLDWQNNFVVMNASNTQSQVKFTDLNIWAASWWGPIRLIGNANNADVQSLTFSNVNYKGSQMISSYGIPVFISGNVNTQLLPSGTYTSPIDGNRVQLDGSGDQEIFESSNVEVLAGANFTGTTAGGTAIVLAAGGTFKIDQGATVTLARTIVGGANETGTNALVYTNGGSVIVEGILNLQALNMPGFSGIYLDGTGSVVVNKSGVINYNSTSANSTGNKAIYITGAGTVNDYGTINISQNGALQNTNMGIIQLNNNGIFVIGNGGTLNVQATNLGTQSSDLINLWGAGNFTFEDGANANISADGSGQVTLLDAQGGGSVISMYHAHKLVFDLTKNTNINSNVFYFQNGGTLKGQLQKIIFGTPNSAAIGPYLSFSIPIYQASLYPGQKATAQGLTSASEVAINALALALTNNKYLEFDTAADNKVNIVPTVTDQSTTVSGTTLPGAYVTLTDGKGNLIKGLPAGTLTADPYDATKYMVQADQSGNWTITLPDGLKLPANTILRATSSINFVKVNYDVVVGDLTSVDNNSAAQSKASATSTTAATATSTASTATSSSNDAALANSTAQSLAKQYSNTTNVASYVHTVSSAASVAASAASVASTAQGNANLAASTAASAASVAAEALENQQSAASTANDALSNAQSAASAAAAASYGNDPAYGSYASAAASYASAASTAVSNAVFAANSVASAASVAASANANALAQQAIATSSASVAASAANDAANALLAEQQAITNTAVVAAKSAADSTNIAADNTTNDNTNTDSSATATNSYTNTASGHASAATSSANDAANAASSAAATAAANSGNSSVASAASAAAVASSTATSAGDYSSNASSSASQASDSTMATKSSASDAQSSANDATNAASSAASTATANSGNSSVASAAAAAAAASSTATSAASVANSASAVANTANSDAQDQKAAAASAAAAASNAASVANSYASDAASAAASDASVASAAASVASAAQATANAENSTATSVANDTNASTAKSYANQAANELANLTAKTYYPAALASAKAAQDAANQAAEYARQQAANVTKAEGYVKQANALLAKAPNNTEVKAFVQAAAKWLKLSKQYAADANQAVIVAQQHADKAREYAEATKLADAQTLAAIAQANAYAQAAAKAAAGSPVQRQLLAQRRFFALRALASQLRAQTLAAASQNVVTPADVIAAQVAAENTAKQVTLANNSSKNAQQNAENAAQELMLANEQALRAFNDIHNFDLVVPTLTDNGNGVTPVQPKAHDNHNNGDQQTPMIPVNVNKPEIKQNADGKVALPTNTQTGLPKTDEQSQTATMLTIIGEVMLGLVGLLGLSSRKKHDDK